MSREQIKRVEIDVKATERAKCNCGWCGKSYTADCIQVDESEPNRFTTTGQASDKASWEGAVHLAKVSGGNANNIKKHLQRRRSYEVPGHTVSIIPEATAKAKSTKI